MTETAACSGRRTTWPDRPYAYDALDQLVSATDPNGGVTLSQYDELDRLTMVTDPLNHQSVLSHLFGSQW